MRQRGWSAHIIYILRRWRHLRSILLPHCRCTVEKTLKASPLNSRRSERPADITAEGTSTLKGSPVSIGATPSGSLLPSTCYPQVVPTYGYWEETLSASGIFKNATVFSTVRTFSSGLNFDSRERQIGHHIVQKRNRLVRMGDTERYWQNGHLTPP